jgi:hypothetical protein
MSKVSRDALAEGTNVDFVEEEENWNVYKLEDGTTLKVKLVLRGVKRLERFEPDGSPIYLINSLNVVRTVNVPSELKKKPKESELPPV